MKLVAAIPADWTDAQLLVRVLSNQDVAWTELVRRYRALIFRCITKVTGRAGGRGGIDVDEIFADVMMQLVRDDMHKLRIYDASRGSKLSSWIGMISINATYDYLRAAGRRPYVVPEGGSNALGSWGYLGCIDELDAQLAALPPAPTTVVYACGSGGTGAGLVVGAARRGWDARGWRVAGVNVCDDRAYFVAAIGRIAADMHARWILPPVAPADIYIVDGHVGLGYARSRPEELATLRTTAARDGLILDPVYTGKAFHGLCTELARDPRRFGARVVFLHTGGVFGLFADGVGPALLS